MQFLQDNTIDATHTHTSLVHHVSHLQVLPPHIELHDVARRQYELEDAVQALIHLQYGCSARKLCMHESMNTCADV
jgi:hypothetical protein